MLVVFLLLFLLLPLPLTVHAEDLGELSANPAGLSGFSGFSRLFSLSGFLVSLVLRSANQMYETNQINLFSFRPTRQTKYTR
jgi:hypothetical protein